MEAHAAERTGSITCCTRQSYTFKLSGTARALKEKTLHRKTPYNTVKLCWARPWREQTHNNSQIKHLHEHACTVPVLFLN